MGEGVVDDFFGDIESELQIESCHNIINLEIAGDIFVFIWIIFGIN